MDDLKMISCLKASSLLLAEDTENEICKRMENKHNVKNAGTLFSLSQILKLSSLSKSSLCFIERCFPMVADSQNFLELAYDNVAKILAN